LNNTADIVNNNEDFLLAVLGTDERKNEKSRSDVIMLVKYKAKENKVIIVSVPRDCTVSIFDKGLAKINAASAYGGSRLQVKVLEKLFKVENVKYIHFNFKGFTKIIDTIGGVEINAEKDFSRDWGEKDVYAKKGKNLLLGDDLLEYVRFRHDEEGDFGRIKRQQEVLLSLASSILKTDNIAKLPEIALIVAKNSASDMNLFFIMRQVKKLKNLDSLEFEFYTLKTASEKSNGIWYEIIDKDHLEFLSDLLQ
jgi:LCP family protein required for cell wall assembly